MAVGEGGEEGKIGFDRRPHAAGGGSAGGVQRRQADVEDVLEYGDILAGDGSRAAASRIAAPSDTAAGRWTSWRAEVPSPPGSASGSPRRRRRVRLRQLRRAPPPRLPRSGPSRFGRARERRAQQHDAEIGVGADRRAGGRDGGPRMRAPTLAPGAEERPRTAAALARNCSRSHPVAVGEDMDIAGFQRLDLAPAGVLIGAADALAARSPCHGWPARRDAPGARRAAPARRPGTAAEARRSRRRC